MAVRRSRTAPFWQSYRRARANVQDHLSAIYLENGLQENVSIQENTNCSFARCEPENEGNTSQTDSFTTSECDIEEYDTACSFSPNSLEPLIPDQKTESKNFEQNLDLLEEHIYFSYMSDSDISVDSSSDSDISLEKELQTWASSFQIPHSALQSLLSILRVYHPFLPKDPRTLLNTSTYYNVVDIDGGSYYHFGLASGLLKLVQSMPNKLNIEASDIDSVLVQFNIDGLPLFKSTNTQFWPILCRVVEPFESKPFVVGLFSGNQKPQNVHEYLQSFKAEVTELIQNGIQVSNTGHNFGVEISCFVCDTPARAFVKQTKGHSGYFGCDKCSQKGRWVNKMTFPEVSAPLRTDVQFDTFQNEEHHRGRSPLSDLPIGMVSQFPLDFMHLVCLGVTRRLLVLWMKGPLFCRQGTGFIAQVTTGILDLKAYMPREFLRKGRPLEEVERWKATEFRQFLLYLGPVILKAKLPDHFYKHFMLLSVAIYCLASPMFCRQYCEYAKQLICLFVSQVGVLYGETQYVYNIHALVHLADDVSRFGALDIFSSFAFESFLGKLKRLVRKPNFPLQQIIRRLSEDCFKDLHCTSDSESGYGIVKNEHHKGPLPREYATYLQFEQLCLPKSFFLSLGQGNNCILARGKVGIIRNILSPNENSLERVLIVENFRNLNNFYTEPLPSSDLRIFQVGPLSGDIVSLNMNEVSCKCVLLPYRDSFVSVPLIHSFVLQ